MPRLLYRGNPLAFPGRSPGFDSRHIAAGPIPRFSAAASLSAASTPQATLTSLFSGQSGSVSAFPSLLMRADIGPCIKFTNSGGAAVASFSGQSTSNDVNITVGAILVVDTLGSNSSFFTNSSGGSTGFTLYKPPSNLLRCFNNQGGDISSGITLSSGIPYFIAMSGNNSATSWVVKRLDTGSLVTAATGGLSPATSGSPSGTYRVGSDAFANTSLSSIAAVMFSAQVISLNSLVTWSADPWAFWYPTTTLDTIFMGLAPPPVAAVSHWFPWIH